MDEKNTFKNYSSNFKRNDWILLAIPLNKMNDTLGQLVSVVQEGSLIVCMTSVQKQAFELLKNFTPKNCDYMGCHPLFGQSISSPIGQIVALTGYKQQASQHIQFQDIISQSGLLVTYLDPAEHDRFMAVVQALTHFCLLSFAGTISANNLSPSELSKLKTPNFQFLYAFASRVLMLSPTTTGSIQSTIEAANMRELFLQSANFLNDKFKNAKGVEECAEIVTQIRNPLAGVEVAEGVEIAAVAVDSLQRFEMLLYKYKTSGNPFVFRHSMTNNLHMVKITDIKHDEVAYIESTKKVDKEGSILFAYGLNEIARTNYKKLGINLHTPLKGSVKKRNIKLLTAEDFRDFNKRSIYPISLEYNYLNPYNKKEDYFEEQLPRLIKGLWSCKFLNAYRRRKEIEKVTVRLVFNPNSKQEDIIEGVRNLIEEDRLKFGN